MGLPTGSSASKMLRAPAQKSCISPFRIAHARAKTALAPKTTMLPQISRYAIFINPRLSVPRSARRHNRTTVTRMGTFVIADLYQTAMHRVQNGTQPVSGPELLIDAVQVIAEGRWTDADGP